MLFHMFIGFVVGVGVLVVLLWYTLASTKWYI